LVGTDASSLELRCLAHYLDDRGYINVVVNGDIHTANQRAAGLKTRDQAKTFIYAFLYGAGPVKLGQIVGGGAAQGANLTKRFLDNVPNLKTLRKNIQEAAQEGPIRGVDGRLLQIRNVHSSVNTLLQGAGAIICKEWLVHMDKYIRGTGLDVKLVASIHDEYQFEVAKKDVNRFGLITKSAMKDAERALEIKCPLDCEYKAGQTWSETH
jgi:DNA polymerase I-like protein with 3'-5' exonuclease and polymerase domains